ncbi:MAG: hypothetical protein ACYTFQ_28570 [Planctomycetota bacterium]|jgi:hypothetical protein
MNIDTGEIKPLDDLTEEEKQSDSWKPVPKKDNAAALRMIELRQEMLAKRKAKNRKRGNLARQSRKKNRGNR